MIDILYRSRFAMFVVRLSCIVAAGVLLIYALRWMPRMTHGFAMYYSYSKTVLDGKSLAPLYDFDAFNERMRTYGITNVVDMPNNPPTAALAALAVAWLSPPVAKSVWTIFSLFAFAGALALLFRAFRIPWKDPPGLLLITLALLWRPVYENVAYGQIYLFLLFGFSLSLFGITRVSPPMTAVPVSASIAVKGYGLPLMLWLALTKRWRELLWGSVIVVGVVAATLPLFGADAWSAYYTSTVSSLGLLPEHAHVAYQTINSMVFHLFTYDTRWLPSPVYPFPTNVIRYISYLLNAAAIIAVLVRSRSVSAPLAFAALLATSVISAPLAEEHHYVLVLPLVIGLAEMMRQRYYVRGKLVTLDVVFLSSTLILALPLPFKSLQLAPPPLVLLAYPKLYAGLALLFCFHRLAPVTSRARSHGASSGSQVPTGVSD